MPSADTHDDETFAVRVDDNATAATRDRFVGVQDTGDPAVQRSNSAFVSKNEEKSVPPARMQRRGTIDNHDELLGTATTLLDSSFTLVSSLGHMLSDGLGSRASKTSAGPVMSGRPPPVLGAKLVVQPPASPSRASVAPSPL